MGYFLIKVHGWSYSKNSFLQLPVDKQNEVLSWFTRDDRKGSELAVWGAGGITEVGRKLNAVIERTRDERQSGNRFDRLVVLIDRDTRTVEDCKKLIAGWLADAGLQLAGEVILDNWTNGTIDLSKTPPEAHAVNTLPIVLPPTLEGCLEVFLADSLLAVSDHDKTIVEKSRELVAKIPDEPYLLKKRLRHKAALGSALSIMSPDWVFGDLDEKLTVVEWENIRAVNAAYTRLGDL